MVASGSSVTFAGCSAAWTSDGDGKGGWFAGGYILSLWGSYNIVNQTAGFTSYSCSTTFGDCNSGNKATAVYSTKTVLDP